ncbi:hypothetical protein GE09DRAFT_93575 [Coniochaeta sp. 2T2.1]|nr:hypothetical protein GE09DRAFT_93575 [Coniochaeta sp. 2T2.1]
MSVTVGHLPVISFSHVATRTPRTQWQLFPAGAGSLSSDAKVDIIAVHGLNPRSKNDTDHAWDTWRTPPGAAGRLWLCDDLPEHLPDSRIFLYQYNSTVVYGKDRGAFIDKANELLEAVRVERDGVESRPIVFLCHSLGGLLVKQALINAHNNPKYASIKNATSGLAFFATPHDGGESRLVRLGKMASKIAMTAGFQKGDHLIDVLENGSMFADIMQEHWRHQLLEYDIVTFWGAFDNIVPRESARLGLPGQRENVVKLNADHRGVCKFGPSEADQDNLKLVRGNMKDLYRSALKTGDTHGNQGGVGSCSPQYTLPYIRSKYYTGRIAILEALQQKLFVRKESQKLAVFGLGGVGKTQVALRFAYWVKEHHREYSIFWVAALSMAAFTQAYEEIARICNVSIDIEREEPKKSVQRYLNSEDAGRWLFIVDNVDDQDLLYGSAEGTAGIHEFLPDNDNGLTLITTRFRGIAAEMAGGDVLELNEMDAQDAEAFLQKSLIHKDLLRDPATTKTLLSELTYLPLAITQAVAYLNRNKTPINKYLELLRGTEQDMTSLMSREFRDKTRYSGSQNAVATTWLVSFEQIQETDAVAADLLSFISCIEPKAIPRSLLPNAQTEQEKESAIGTLSAYAFLVRRDDDDVYDMHRLVQLATRIWIREQERTQETAVRAMQHVYSIFPSWRDHFERPVWQAYFPHAFRLLDDCHIFPCQERSDLVASVGSCLLRDRRFKEAMRYFKEDSDWAREHLAPTDMRRLFSEYHLGRGYLELRRPKDAIKTLEHVLEVQKETFHEEDPDRLKTEGLLAVAYHNEGRVRDAIGIFKRVAEVQKRICGEEDQDLQDAEHGLAAAYLDEGRKEDAIRILEHVAEVNKKKIDEEDDRRLTSEQNLACAYLGNGQTAEAIRILEHVVAVQKRILDEEDDARLCAEHNLASAYFENGQTEEAIRILEHVVAVQNRILAEDDQVRQLSESLLRHAHDRLNSNRGASTAKDVEGTGTTEGSLTHEVEARGHRTKVSAAETGGRKKPTKVSKHVLSFKRLFSSRVDRQ